MTHNQFNLEIFRKDYGFLSYTKNLGKNSDKNIGTNLSGKCSQKLLDHAKQSATDAFKTWFKINDHTVERITPTHIILMLKSSLCDYSDAYILLSATITNQTETIEKI